MRFRDAILNDIYGEKISENIAVDNNGQLICSNCILARTGYYDYRESELLDGGSEDKIVKVYRSPEEVFDEVSMKSMNFKPLVNDHPQDNVTPESVSYLQKGFVTNTRRGDGEFSECLMADIVVTDPYVIDLIKSGDKRELSVGYTSDIEEKDGKYFMKNIRGNHVALCDAGRAGIAKIRDSKTVKDETKYVSESIIKRAIKKVGKDPEEIWFELRRVIPEATYTSDKPYVMEDIYKVLGLPVKDSAITDMAKLNADALSFKIGEYALSTNGFSGIITEVHPNFIFIRDKNGDEHLVEKRFVERVSKTKIQDEYFDESPKYVSGEVVTRGGEKWTIIKSEIQKGHINYWAKDKNGFEAWIGPLDDNYTFDSVKDSEPSPSTIKLSNGSIVNFYGWAERNGYGATYYSVGTKTRGGFIFKAHFENEQLAKNYSVSSEESTVVVRSRIGITKSEVVDSLKKFVVKVNGKSYATNARTHADAVKKVSKVLSDSGSDKYYIFLEKLRKSGVTNMFGAAPYLVKEFGVDSNTARTILSDWMNNYDELSEKFNWRRDSKELNDTIQYPEAKQLIAKARDLGFLFEGQVNGEWVFHFGKAPFSSLSVLAEEGKKINPNYKQVVHGNKIFIGDNSIKDAKDCVITLEGKKYKCILYGIANDPNYVDVFIPELVDLYGRIISSPKDDKGYRPKDGKFFIEKRRFKKENPTAIADNSVKDAIEDGTYEFITIKNGETDSTFIKANSQKEAMAIFRNNNGAGKLLEYGVWKGGRYRAFGDSLDSQSTEKMAQLKYDELNEKLKALENEIDQNDNNPNYNLVGNSRELEKLQDEISKLKKDFGYALKDSRG